MILDDEDNLDLKWGAYPATRNKSPVAKTKPYDKDKKKQKETEPKKDKPFIGIKHTDPEVVITSGNFHDKDEDSDMELEKKLKNIVKGVPASESKRKKKKCYHPKDQAQLIQ